MKSSQTIIALCRTIFSGNSDCESVGHRGTTEDSFSISDSSRSTRLEPDEGGRMVDGGT